MNAADSDTGRAHEPLLPLALPRKRRAVPPGACSALARADRVPSARRAPNIAPARSCGGIRPLRGGRVQREAGLCALACRRAVQLRQGAPQLPAGCGGRRGAQRAGRPRLAGGCGRTQRGAVLVPHSGAAAGQPTAPGAHADAAGAPAPDALRCAGSNPAVYEHPGRRHTASSREPPSLDRATQ